MCQGMKVTKLHAIMIEKNLNAITILRLDYEKLNGFGSKFDT